MLDWTPMDIDMQQAEDHCKVQHDSVEYMEDDEESDEDEIDADLEGVPVRSGVAENVTANAQGSHFFDRNDTEPADNADSMSGRNAMPAQGEGVELNNRAVVQRPGYVCLQKEDGSSDVYVKVTYQTASLPLGRSSC